MMQCPSCGTEIELQSVDRKGTHADCKCSCGQLLQWDQAIRPSGRREQWRFGSPQPCKHDNLRKPGTLIPL